MAIQTVRANINGTWHNLTYNATTEKWTATLNAPGATSYNLQGGFYNVQVEATNTAGTVGTADASTMDSLKLVVKETIAPVVTILSPTNGAYVTNNRQPVVFNVVDEQGGSGIDLSTIVVKVDGAAVSALTVSGVTNDATSSSVAVAITLNGTSQGTVTVNADGTFPKAITLANGANTIKVRSTDSAGKYTEITRTVTLDTSVPQITQVNIVPNPVDAGETMLVEVTVS